MVDEAGEDNSEIKEVKKPSWRPAVIGFSFVVTLWTWTFLSFTWDGRPDWFVIGERGTFGDMFGGLNALFSGLAFAGIILTIYMQRKELTLQRKELKFTRETLEAQRAEMVAQNETLKTQQFENTFFSMLRVFNDIVNSLDHPQREQLINGDISIVTIRGRDCISMYLSEFKKSFHLVGATVNGQKQISLEDIDFENIFEGFWKKWRSSLGHYFRTLYHLVQFVKDSEVDDKLRYTTIIRAQLSDQEQALLFYDCLSTYGANFKQDVIDFKLIKNVQPDMLLCEEHLELYPSSVFERGTD